MRLNPPAGGRQGALGWSFSPGRSCFLLICVLSELYLICWQGCVWRGFWGGSVLLYSKTVAFPTWPCENQCVDRTSFIDIISHLTLCIQYMRQEAVGSKWTAQHFLTDRKAETLTLPAAWSSFTVLLLLILPNAVFEINPSFSQKPPLLWIPLWCKMSYLRIMVIVSFRSLPWNGSDPVSISY